MIYTVTCNPALDYVIKTYDLALGKVNRSNYEKIHCGGKGINVSIVLQRLGIPSVALGFVAGFTGKEIEEGVKQQNIHTDFIHLQEGMSRINVKIKAEEETEINAQGPQVHDEELALLYQKIDALKEGDVLVLAGSIPATLPADLYEQMMKRLADKKIEVVVDATKELLKKVLPFHPFLIKPNHHELGELFGTVFHTEEEMIEAAKKLQQMGARNILVSMAAKGSIFLSEEGEVYKIAAPDGKAVNSVGAGDSMVAGFLASYTKEQDYEKALRYASATGSATALSEGLAHKELVEELLTQI